MSLPTVTDVRFEHHRPGQALGVKIERIIGAQVNHLGSVKVISPESRLVPWPLEQPLASRTRCSVSVRARQQAQQEHTAWSDPAILETGLLHRRDWSGQLISAPWAGDDIETPLPEDLFRKNFTFDAPVQSARLYITALGVYEAEINGTRVGDHFLAPGWTSYDAQLIYQTHDVTDLLSSRDNCLGVRVAEGWFKGRIGFEGGRRNIWGPRTAVLAQLEIIFDDGSTRTITTDDTWTVNKGPIQRSEIYDGELYDATAKVPGWSIPGFEAKGWAAVDTLPPIADTVQFHAGDAEPTVLDFGQNLVGYLRVNKVRGPRGHKITLLHAGVLEKGELGIRPLRDCKARDIYALRGDEAGESYEPRFTFHGFRYAQVDDWPSADIDILDSLEAVVCNTDMEEAGNFTCSDEMLNKLYSNVRWGMRGNFLSVPTDCPQRDEQLGWTGDLALFAPTATFIYDCTGILKNWLRDLWDEQKRQDGVPPMVVPNNKTGSVHLWDFAAPQLGDWLDPNASPHEPWKAVTDPPLVANAFLIYSLDAMSQIAGLLGKELDATRYRQEAAACRLEFAAEYVSPNSRLPSDTQTVYALAITFNLLTPAQLGRAGDRLAEIVRRNTFRVGTGFAGTPYICEALAQTGHSDVAYAMLTERACPSWLFPVTMGATTMWERWDSMRPDGSVNPGDMTSFNHYAYGAVAKFMVERLAGLKRAEAGWKRARTEPEVGGDFTWARAEHLTPYGRIASSWRLEGNEGNLTLTIDVVVPPTTEMEVVIPGDEPRTEIVGSGEWSFSVPFTRRYEWPVKPISAMPV
ncbi:bacterial alpha-L-rhamnosidase domain-containing protein [Verticillium dahliae]|nr:bacterial alpha-L-rhamnosidase domain-containing protein [Verticillium dahliae]